MGVTDLARIKKACEMMDKASAPEGQRYAYSDGRVLKVPKSKKRRIQVKFLKTVWGI